MKTYRCLIVDESSTDSLTLASYLSKLSFIDNMTSCASYVEAIPFLATPQFDLVFFGVDCQDLRPLTLFSALPGIPPLIVMSTDTSCAATCYDLDVADFIVKPIEPGRLMRAINRALGIFIDNESISTRQFTFLKTGRRLQRFAFEEIDFIEAYGIYAKIHYCNKIVVINEPIIAMEKRLPSQLFRRVHKSYIINLNHITAYSQNSFYIDETKIPIGVSYRPDLPNIYNMLN